LSLRVGDNIHCRGTRVVNDTILPETGLVRLRTVLSVIQLSRTRWYKGVQRGEFPPPVKVGARSLWRAEDIHALIERLSGTNPTPQTPKGETLPFHSSGAGTTRRRRS
jgi:predicted DNA-binding transcriptional regulator AlpA